MSTTRLKTLPSQRGITLTEIVAAIGIVLVLVAILVPVLVSAKRKAKEASDINELHQLGLAGAMYQEQYGDFPTGTAPLVQSGLAPASICSGLVDPYPQGQANALVSVAEKHYGLLPGTTMVTRYRNSFVGPREFGMSMAQLKKHLKGATSEGWLVDLSSGTQTDPIDPLWVGPYRRLLNDTSVVSKRMDGRQTTYQGRPSTQYFTYEYFGDLPP